MIMLMMVKLLKLKILTSVIQKILPQNLKQMNFKKLKNLTSVI